MNVIIVLSPLCDPKYGKTQASRLVDHRRTTASTIDLRLSSLGLVALVFRRWRLPVWTPQLLTDLTADAADDPEYLPVWTPQLLTDLTADAAVERRDHPVSERNAPLQRKQPATHSSTYRIRPN